MKKVLFAFLFVFYGFYSSAQKISIFESTEEIDKITRTGLGVVVDLDKKALSKSWEKYLKNFGKVESSKNVFTVQTAKMPTISSDPCRIVSEVKKSKKGVMVWWTIEAGTFFVTQDNDKSAYKAAEKLLYDFIHEALSEDIQEQVKDAEKALSAAEKDEKKVVKEGDKLVKDVDKNRKEKSKLEKALKDNEKEHEDLLKEIEKNKKDQKKAAAETAKMQQAVEVVKGKLKQVGK
ncbi:hypothetical protein RCC89_04145 [Cytophagaceae bacterium ABcell3]|nr:hypothetical protein RCC89_04145 [Cytophagaceae bacterium ABcell3]